MAATDTVFQDSGNLWMPLKDLAAIVDAAVLKHQPGLKPELESTLQTHKSQFVSLLKNPVRNSNDADLVRKASSEGIKLATGDGSSVTQKLPSPIVDEAFIISDMFKLNEISSLHLLLQAEDQLCQYPGLTRGLVAVLLYYDGQRSLVQSLRTLIQGRQGVTWTLGAPFEVTEFITAYTDDLLNEGLVDKILSVLGDLDWTKESVTLQRNLALGDAKHRRLVYNLYEDIRQGLADCLFAFAAQSGLPREALLRLLGYLSTIKPTEGGAEGELDDVHLTLTMAALYALSASVVTKGEDDDSTVQQLPILSDPEFIPAVHGQLGPLQTKRWQHLGIQAALQFAWSMSLATLRSSTIQLPNVQNVLEDDEAVLDSALELGLFHSLPHCLMTKKTLTSEEFYLRRLHQLVTDLIVLMPLKVKELRNRADESARNKLIHENEGLIYAVPLGGQHLEHLLNSVATLYSTDKLGLSLMLEYWCPSASDNAHDRLPMRQVSLNKFIRLMGDLLMPSLFKPYVDMLVSLSGHPQAAHHCFNLLKTNAGTSTVSWDHFFSSLHQYFANLRQENQLGSSIDTIYRVAARPMTRGISPAEVHGLVSVLRLMSTVCSQSEMARVAMAENPNWQPILVHVGLLSCSVPTVLKSEIIITLAALAKTPDIGHLIWTSIESAKIIAPPIGVVQHQPHGLLNELQDVESRNEEYPLCRAFLSLLRVLLGNKGASVPATVSVQPYVAFVRDQVLLRFHARAYKRPEERWEVGYLALKIVHSLLVDYQPSEQDFDDKVNKTHPALSLMSDLMQSSELLRQLLFILDEGCNWLEKYLDFPGKEILEDCCLQVLKIFERGLELQPRMLEIVRATGTRQLLNPLDRLLLGLNPRSGKPDHMFNTVKFVIFAWWLPKHGLAAVNILRHVSASSSAQPLLLANFTQNDLVGHVIMKGFTEMIENEFAEEDVDNARIAVIDLILQGLNFPAPTLSHFLLGFDLRSIARSTIQSPGVLGSVRSPLHAILSLLRPIDHKTPSPLLKTSPQVAEAAYRLIYTLALNAQTSEPVMRFLRSSEDFLNHQLSVLPLSKEYDGPQVSKAVSWLLKTVAIELKVLSASRQRSLLSRTTMLLLDGRNLSLPGAASGQRAEDGTGDASLTQLSRITQPLSMNIPSQVHRLLAQLNAIDFTDRTVRPPVLEIFDPTQIGNILKQLETTSEASGAKAVDVKALHSVLVGHLQGATMGQKQLLEEEIQRILSYAVNWNSRQDYIMTQRNLLDAWRQVTEILLCCVPLDILPASTKQQLLLELLQVLLNKVLSDESLAELSNPVSGVVLLLLVALRQTYNTGDSRSASPDAFVTILDSMSADRDRERSSRMYSTALQVILKGTISWVIETSSSAQRARANLYCALLNYFLIGNDDSTSVDVSRLRKANFDVLSSFGDVFIDVVCRDAVSGHDVRKMLALSLLDTFSSSVNSTSGPSASWLWYMSRQGYLRHIIESLVLEDQRLIQLVASSKNEQIKALYTYESKMALLTRLASTSSGAELLLETGLMLRLAEMSVFSARPETMPGDEGPLVRYQQILFPALRVCQALLSSLGSTNRSVTAQVIHFIGANECLVRDALYYKDLFTSTGLQEMSLLSGVLARCAWIDVNDAMSFGPEISARLNRVQRQMLSFLSHFGSVESTLKKVDNTLNARLLLESHANAIIFARNLVTNGPRTRIVFGPSLAEATLTTDALNTDPTTNVAFSNRPPSLGHLALVVRHLVDHMVNSSDRQRQTSEKLTSINVLSTAELSEYLPINVAEKLSSSDRRALASTRMQADIERLNKEIQLSGEAIEGGLFILWKHLENFFSLTTISSKSVNDDIFGSLPTSASAIEKLREDLPLVFDKNFLMKIVEVEKIQEKERDCFIEAVIRRIKRLSLIKN